MSESVRVSSTNSRIHRPEPLAPDVVASLESIWVRLAAEIGSTGVVCQQSGNCCNFDEWEHIAFASTLELRHLMTSAEAQPADLVGKLCPFWKQRKCTAHAARPLGCRVFFCDKAYETAHSQRIYETYHGEIQQLSERAEEAYAYLPMVAAMQHYSRTGQFYDPARPFSLFSDPGEPEA